MNKFKYTLIIILIMLMFSSLIYVSYDKYKEESLNKETKETILEFEGNISKVIDNIANIENNSADNDLIIKEPIKFNGYLVVGIIEIPKIKIEHPILNVVTTSSLNVSVGLLYGNELNKRGNVVIAGHNLYGKDIFFSNLNNLLMGDIIYITDQDGTRLKYTIYKIYETSKFDVSYLQRNIGEGIEITLSTCAPKNMENRLIIWAKVD